MKESKYQNREIDHFIKDIKDTLQKQNETLERIETQTTKTNGRVSNLEFWRNTIIASIPIALGILYFLLNYFKK